MFNDFIGVFENNVPPKLCNELIEWYDWGVEHSLSISGSKEFEDNGINPHLRKDNCVYIPGKKLIPQYYPHPQISEYRDCLEEIVQEYCKHYSVYFDGALIYLEYKIHKVEESEAFHSWHYETPRYDSRDRVLVAMTYLKVPEEGGETEFLNQKQRIKPVVGTSLIWPAGFTHIHRGNPPLKGNKIYITGWFNIQPVHDPPSA